MSLYDVNYWKQQNEARVRFLSNHERWERSNVYIREQVMLLDSALNYYDNAKISKGELVMHQKFVLTEYQNLVRLVQLNVTKEEFYELFEGDISKMVIKLIEKYGRKPLPKAIDDDSYQDLHPKTKSEWGIKKPIDISTF